MRRGFPLARQALAAARTLRQRLEALNATLALELGLCAEYSIVVHVGPIAFAPVGRSGERTHQPVGEAVHAAKALLDGGAAGRGSLIVSRAAAEAAGEAIADAGARRVVARHAQGTIEAVVRETSG